MILGRKISKEEKVKPLEIHEEEKVEETKQNEEEKNEQAETKEEELREEHPEVEENEQEIDEKNPPIFIKIDKYREILASLTEMKLLVHKIISNISLIQKIEEIEIKAYENSRTFFEELNKKLDELSAYFMANSSEMKKIPEMEELKKLEEEIEKLKKSLED